MKYFIKTFGCKVNSFESSAMASLLEEQGYLAADDDCAADLVVVNSCTVTGTGDRKTAQYLRHIRRGNPGAVIVLSGCLPQAYPEAAAALGDADIVTGTGSRLSLPALIDRFLTDHQRMIAITENDHKDFENLTPERHQSHTRAFLKIEDGCDRHCAYCIVPQARGPVRSLPPDQIAAQAERFARAGYREIVISGINLSRYGKDLDLGLADAVRAAAVEGVERLRLGSLEPDLLPQPLLEQLAAVPALCPHFHLSLQSGCDATLRRMGRRYTVADYLDTVARIRALFDRPTFTTDMIVGFPGETEAEFEQSLRFVRALGLLKVHVFPYSPRPGTPAAGFPDQIPGAEKNRRAAILSQMADEARLETLRAFVGRPERVILETPLANGFGGYTDRYLPALVTGPELRRGDTVRGVISEVRGGRCVIAVTP